MDHMWFLRKEVEIIKTAGLIYKPTVSFINLEYGRVYPRVSVLRNIKGYEWLQQMLHNLNAPSLSVRRYHHVMSYLFLSSLSFLLASLPLTIQQRQKCPQKSTFRFRTPFQYIHLETQLLPPSNRDTLWKDILLNSIECLMKSPSPLLYLGGGRNLTYFLKSD